MTRCIQELLISAKDEKFDSFIPCSERIVRAVTDMVLLFPEEPGHTAISANLSSLTAAANHFESECRMLIVRSQREPGGGGYSEGGDMERQTAVCSKGASRWVMARRA